MPLGCCCNSIMMSLSVMISDNLVILSIDIWDWLGSAESNALIDLTSWAVGCIICNDSLQTMPLEYSCRPI